MHPWSDAPPDFAFPVNRDMGNGTTFVSSGMTLRDYFAAKAMQALIANDYLDDSVLAQQAFRYADAMLKEREP